MATLVRHTTALRGVSRGAGARVAWLTLLVSVPFAAVAVLLGLHPDRPTEGVGYYKPETALWEVAYLASMAVGALVLSRKPNLRRVGWLFWAVGVLGIASDFTYNYGVHAVRTDPGSLPAGNFVAWLASPLYAPVAAPAALLLLTFPDGRLPSRRWRWVVWLTAAALAADLATAPLVWPEPREVLLEVGAGEIGGIARVLIEVQSVLFPLVMLLGAVALLLRLRRARGIERQQLKWLAYAGLMIAAPIVVFFTLGVESRAIGAIAAIGAVAFPVAAGIAILRHHLFDIDVVIRRSLIYGALSLAIGAAYVGVAAALGIAAGDRLPLAVAVLVAIGAMFALQPLRRRLQAVASRRVFGERLTAYELLARLGETLEHAFDPAELARSVATAVQAGFGASWVRITVVPSTAATAGERFGTAEVVVPLVHGGEELGAIECGAKEDREPYSDDDLELLETLGRQAGLAIRNARQAAELAASRARIVQAQDAERRRIERNIHDGVQQELVALIAKLRLARNQLGRDPAAAEPTLAELQGEAAAVLDDLRELARGIHPSVLTDRGLVDAVEARAARLPIEVRIDADGPARERRYADEIEGAAYFVVSEGIANALKHSGARRIDVRIRERDRRLVLEVADYGGGFDPARGERHGLASLSDRVEALGGRLAVASRPGGGTSLVGELPVDG